MALFWCKFDIASCNGVVPSRQQVMVWTKDGLANWRIYASHGFEELIDHIASL